MLESLFISISVNYQSNYSMIVATLPEPTVRPPSRILELFIEYFLVILFYKITLN